MMSFETAIYNTLAAAIEDAEEGDALFEVELLPTNYDRVTALQAIRVGDANFDLAPGSGGAVEEWDILATLDVLAYSDSEDATTIVTAREKVREITIAVAQVLLDDPTLGNAINDSRILGGNRGWGSLKTAKYAVARLHLIGNETGSQQ